MGLYGQFKTDQNLENKGVVLEYGEGEGATRIRIARAGGANKAFSKRLEALTKPHRRAIQTGTIDPNLGNRLMRQCYAETVVIGWETHVDGEWKSGIEGPDGELLPFSSENVMATFENLPDLFADIQAQASNVTLFREEIVESDAGN